MGDINPEGVENLLKKWKQNAPDAKDEFARGMTQLLQDTFKDQNIAFHLAEDTIDNIYAVDGKLISHKSFVSMLKSMGKKENDF